MAVAESVRPDLPIQTITGQPSQPLNFIERLALLVYSLEFVKNPAEYMIKSKSARRAFRDIRWTVSEGGDGLDMLWHRRHGAFSEFETEIHGVEKIPSDKKVILAPHHSTTGRIRGDALLPVVADAVDQRREGEDGRTYRFVMAAQKDFAMSIPDWLQRRMDTTHLHRLFPHLFPAFKEKLETGVEEVNRLKNHISRKTMINFANAWGFPMAGNLETMTKLVSGDISEVLGIFPTAETSYAMTEIDIQNARFLLTAIRRYGAWVYPIGAFMRREPLLSSAKTKYEVNIGEPIHKGNLAKTLYNPEEFRGYLGKRIAENLEPDMRGVYQFKKPS